MRGGIKYTAAPYGREVLFCPTPQVLRAACRKYNLEDAPSSLGTTWDTDGPIVIAVRDGDVRTLVHECCHATLFVLKMVGIDPYASSGEPMAYLLDDMVGRFLPHLSPAAQPASPGPGVHTA